MLVVESRLTELSYTMILGFLKARAVRVAPEEKERILSCAEELRRVCVPRVVYKILPVENDNIKGFEIPGEDVKKLLKGCVKAVMMAATVGTAPVQLAEKENIKDPGRGLIMDAAGSAAVENVCDNFEEDLRSALKEESLFLTRRFSPGYGDMPLSIQPDFIRFLDATKRAGISVTESCLMIPQKSVTAVMGIYEDEH